MKKLLSYISDYWRNLDKALLTLCLLLSGFSVFLLYTLDKNGISGQVSSRQWKINLAAALIGAAVALIIAAIDYKFISKL